MSRLLLALLLVVGLGALSACQPTVAPENVCPCDECDCGELPPSPPTLPASPSAVPPAQPAGVATMDVVAPLQAAIVAVRDEVQQATIAIAPPPAAEDEDAVFTACAVKLITRWEVSGEAAYTRKWQGVIWPCCSSGPTFGIGYDGGHQTRLDIARDWADHIHRADLINTSGVTGSEAGRRVASGEWKHVRTPYAYAAEVFVQASLPTYTQAARRALGPAFDQLPAKTKCGLVSVGYNRGWQTVGARRTEIRTIRDICLDDLFTAPACTAAETRRMKRLWPNVPGLQARREDEARTMESV